MTPPGSHDSLGLGSRRPSPPGIAVKVKADGILPISPTPDLCTRTAFQPDSSLVSVKCMLDGVTFRGTTYVACWHMLLGAMEFLLNPQRSRILALH